MAHKPLLAATTIAFVLMLVLNAYHGANGDMRSAAYAHLNLLTPADAYFSIFGPIYLLLIVFLVREWLSPNTTIPGMRNLYLLFLLSCPFNMGYMQFMVAGYVHWAFACIFIMWLLLFAAYLIVEDSVRPVLFTTLLFSTNNEHEFASTSLADFLWIRMPFTVYWAWTCAAATIALNVSVEELGIHAMPIYIFWCGLWVLANIIILIGTGDAPFAFIALWALVGIAQGSLQRANRLVPANPNYVEHYAIYAMASAGSLIFTGLFLFLMLHKWWRGGAKFPWSAEGTQLPSKATIQTNDKLVA
ncbi:hypothetical protein THRCLA_00330 [Thraustotheca clavata]|uniref:Uncharacterized protein n=1 Tax=Thraustotheca clavata TaxID=74557 RepID=A0A1W0ABW1_9STRA|nr:hypothetical protein THRCLA_00330 [Thraustotheca clavata]